MCIRDSFHSFKKTVTRVTGNVAIQVSANEGMLDELVVKKIRKHPFVDFVNPVINLSAKVINPKNDSYLLNIQAVDVLEWFGTDTLDLPQNNSKDLTLDYLTDTDVLFLHQDAANQLNLKKGDSLILEVDNRQYQVRLGGVFEANNLGRTLDSLAVMDIAAAQTLFALVGFVDRYDLTIHRKMSIREVIQDLQQTLGSTIFVGRPAQRNQQVERMLKSFQLNLTTLSMVGLFVGVFLVYNVIGFSVVQYLSLIHI